MWLTMQHKKLTFVSNIRYLNLCQVFLFLSYLTETYLNSKKIDSSSKRIFCSGMIDMTFWTWDTCHWDTISIHNLPVKCNQVKLNKDKWGITLDIKCCFSGKVWPCPRRSWKTQLMAHPMANRALDGSTYPGQKLVHSSLCKKI
jgi:hypothetical protein